MENKNEIQNELQEISRKLKILEKKEIFSVSENYFTELKESIHAKTHSKRHSNLYYFKSLILNRTVRISFVVFLITVVSTITFIKLQKESASQKVENYILSNIDSDLMSDYLINNISTDNSKTDTEFNDNILENIDENLIIEEL